jgi:hypothetical protein
MLQQAVTQDKTDLRVLGGKQIGRYEIKPELKGYLSRQQVQDGKAFVQANAVLVQNIVAHIQNPMDHIQIIGSVLPKGQGDVSVILDTVNQLIVKKPWSSFFVLGLLNSTLINWFVYRFIFARAIRTMHFDSPVTERIPLRNLELGSPADKKRHDAMVKKVEAMLEAKKKLAAAQTDKDKNFYERRCSTLDRQIDRLVYDLYELTEDEIAIVEGTTE